MSTNQIEVSEQIIACNPGAIDSADRDSHVAVAKSIFSSSVILETKELANGYAFRLPLETPMLLKVAQWIANERLCCAFFTFTLRVDDQLWIELTGTPEVKDLISMEILPLIKTGDFPTIDALQAVYDAATSSSDE